MAKSQQLKNLERLQQQNRGTFAIPENQRKTFRLDIRRIYTDVDGQIVDKSTVPASIQKRFPVFLFGTFDQQGGYYIGFKNLPPEAGTDYYFNATIRNYDDPLLASAFNNIDNLIFKIGDHVIVYADDINAPTYFIWIVISAEQRSYSSILMNPQQRGLDVFQTKFFADNENQYLQNLMLTYMDEIGNYQTDNLNPFTYKTTDYQQDTFIDIPLPLKINNYFGLNFYMDFRADLLSFIFNYYRL